MPFDTLLAPRRVRRGVDGISKKRTLEYLANVIAEDQPGMDADSLFRALIGREKLGSTGLGHGIAIPHARVGQCQGTVGALLVLNQPVDFDAIDGEPVDIVFALLVPEDATGDHLQTLAKLAELFQQPAFRDSLRRADSDQALYTAFARALS